MPESTSQLSQLTSCYFHQDYDLEAQTPDGNVRNFVDDEGPDATGELIDELVEVLARQPSEQELEQLWVHRLRASFEPFKIGLTYREWFVRMLEILRAH